MGTPLPRSGEAVQEKTDQKTQKPSMYKVYLLNDDYTTMEFVVHVLESIFRKPSLEAVQIMLHVHKKGRGLAGVYTREIAENKIHNTHELARKHSYPLKCSMEKE